MSNKRVVFDLQLSSFDSQGSLKFASDSNFVFTQELLRTIKDKYWTMTLVPRKMWGLNSLAKDTVCQYVEYGTDYYSARFQFDWDAVLESLLGFKPDLVWTNNPMWVPFYRAVLRKAKLDVPIVTYNHWIDLPNTPKEPNKYSLQYLQLAGMVASDCVLVNSNWGIDLVNTGVRLLTGNDFKGKIVAFPPPLGEWQRSQCAEPKYCVYNHRLSSHSYYAEAQSRLKELMKGVNSKIIFTNPSGKEVSDSFEFPHEFVSLDRQQYLEMLSKAYCSVSTLIDPGAQWSMAIVDSVACGVPTLVPDYYGYSEILPESYPLYYESLEEAKCKLEKLIERSLDISWFARYVRDQYGPAKTLERFDELVSAI